MKAIFVIAWGALLIFMGTSVFLWVAYNLLVEMQPEAEGRNPVLASSIALGMMGVGVTRVRNGMRAMRSGDGSESA